MCEWNTCISLISDHFCILNVLYDQLNSELWWKLTYNQIELGQVSWNQQKLKMKKMKMTFYNGPRTLICLSRIIFEWAQSVIPCLLISLSGASNFSQTLLSVIINWWAFYAPIEDLYFLIVTYFVFNALLSVLGNWQAWTI